MQYISPAKKELSKSNVTDKHWKWLPNSNGSDAEVENDFEIGFGIGFDFSLGIRNSATA